MLLFSDGVWGWQLDQAQRLLERDRHRNADQAALSILISYFEMIVQYRDGIVDGRGKSEELFKSGVRWVLDRAVPPEGADRMADRLYGAVRNGLYHEAVVRDGIVLVGELPPGVSLLERPTTGGVELAINVRALLVALQRHFAGYVLSLLDQRNESLRTSFAQRVPPE